jgi:hypothetical protein
MKAIKNHVVCAKLDIYVLWLYYLAFEYVDYEETGVVLVADLIKW